MALTDVATFNWLKLRVFDQIEEHPSITLIRYLIESLM